MIRFFCYGTLKRRGSAHDILAQWSPQFLGEVTTHTRYQLYDRGWFPCMVEGQDHPGAVGVRGELFEVPEGCLPSLDRYEGVASGLFRRAEIELSDGSKAIAYLSDKPGVKIESGVWSGETQKAKVG